METGTVNIADNLQKHIERSLFIFVLASVQHQWVLLSKKLCKKTAKRTADIDLYQKLTFFSGSHSLRGRETSIRLSKAVLLVKFTA